MKCLKKLTGILLALAMVFSMSTTVFAAETGTKSGSITINNAVVDQTYTVYQILELESYSNNSYSYKATPAWNGFINSDAIKDTYVKVDGNGYVTWVEGADVAAFAKAAQKYAADNSIANQGSKKADSASVTFNNLELGYYLVDSSLGTLCNLDTTKPDATIQEKNQAPSNEKKVEEDSTGDYGGKNDADIGQTVKFKSTITAQAGAQNYVFHDKMDAGVTFSGVDSVSIMLNGATVAASNYTVTAPAADGDTFDVAFTQAFCDTLKANDEIVISYSATLNENAVVGGTGNKNESKLTYGEEGKTEPSETTTFTWDVDIFKYTKDGEKEKPLPGATFTLSKNEDGSDPIHLINKGNNVYRVAKNGETSTVTAITTDATGKFTIEGLDADTYYLTETVQPAGYNKLAAPVTIVIGENGVVTVNGTTVDEVKVENKTGTELPSTGGMGTTLFYVGGGVLVVGAAVLLIVKKRMKSEK